MRPFQIFYLAFYKFFTFSNTFSFMINFGHKARRRHFLRINTNSFGGIPNMNENFTCNPFNGSTRAPTFFPYIIVIRKFPVFWEITISRKCEFPNFSNRTESTSEHSDRYNFFCYLEGLFCVLCLVWG